MKKINYLIIIILSQFLFSCSSTQIVSSWRDPDKQLHKGDWNKVLVLALLRNETNRRRAEDEMITLLNGKGIKSYTYLDANFDKKDEEALRSKIKADGFDAAITMRLIDVEKEKIYTPQQHYIYPAYYQDFSAYYNRNRMYYTEPEDYTVSKKFIIETIIYSIKDNKIIWSGITETFNPKGVEKLTNEIAKTLHKKMLDEGFIEE